MLPFCCVSTVSDHSPIKPLPDRVIAMPPPPHPHPVTTTSSSAPSFRSKSARSTAQNQCFSNQNHHSHHHRSASVDSYRISLRNGTPSGREATASAPPPQVDVKLNNIVGNGISGVVYKWVNYGKGWRPRWFVLQDGVLSYYKLHGPDRIVVSQETEKGSKVIGEESLRIISRHRNSISQRSITRREPCGEVHLKVRNKKF